MVRPALWCTVVALCVAGGAYAQQAAQTPPPQQPQQPVFRAGVNLVQVDAYPTGPDGKIVEGLSLADFQILEDGKPQQIESSEFIRVDLNTPEAERRDPNTQEEATGSPRILATGCSSSSWIAITAACTARTRCSGRWSTCSIACSRPMICLA